MARIAKATQPAPPAPIKRGPGRPRKPVSPPAPKLSKDELRARVAKMERANESLRAKAKAAKRTSDARIAELEAMLLALEVKPTPAARPKRGRRPIDPGDAAPPGGAVLEPEPMDEEAEAATESLHE